MIRRKRTVNYLIGGLGTLALITGGFFYLRNQRANPLDKYLTVKADRGSVKRTVSSTGTLQAVITVQVGSQVSGRIQELHADFNSVVKKGQILAVVDPANFQAQQDRAQAGLATALAAVKNAEANVNNRRADLLSMKASLEVAKVALRDADRQYKRAQGLLKDGLISDRDLETAQVNFDQGTARVSQSEAQVSQSEAALRSSQAQQDQAVANVKQARAELQMAEVNLRYTNIISPIDGVVIERSVDIGQTVAASFQAPVLFLLANDLARMQVIAQIDEADIGVISEKARASFTVDAFPGQTFQGKISEIRLSSKLPGSSSTTTTTSTGSASNVVVYNVMIDVDNPQLKLRPGMTTNVNFTVANVDNVLRIANSAMRYRPADKSPEEIQKIMAALSGTASADTRTSGVQSDSTAVPVKRPPADRTMGTQPSTERSTSNGGGSASWQGRMERHSGNWSARGTTGGATAIVGPSQTNVYGIDAGMKIRFPSAEDSKAQWTIIWVLDAQGTLQPRRVKLGITDGRQTAVLQGDLKEGEVVVTGELNEDTNQQQRAASPFRGPFGGSGGGARRGGR